MNTETRHNKTATKKLMNINSWTAGVRASLERRPSFHSHTICDASGPKSILFLRYQRIHSKQLHIMLCSVVFVLDSTIVCISFISFSSDSCVWCRNSNKFYALLLTALALRAPRIRFSVACMHCSRPLFTICIWCTIDLIKCTCLSSSPTAIHITTL